MKLKSETKQVIAFIKAVRLKSAGDRMAVSDICKENCLNYDMVQRALILLNKAGVISRDTRGPRSAYEYPPNIGLGSIISAVEGITIADGYTINYSVMVTLNNIRI